jgi:transposase
MVEQGHTVVEIAIRLQRGEATVRKWLNVAGVAKPGTHAAAVRIAEREAKFAELSAQGHQLTDIAYRLGIPMTTLKRWRAGRTAGNRLRRENEGAKKRAKYSKTQVKAAQERKPNTGKLRGKQLNLL